MLVNLGVFLHQVIGNMPAQPPAEETDAPVQTSPGIPPAGPPSFPEKAPLTLPVLNNRKEPVSVSGQHIFKYDTGEKWPVGDCKLLVIAS